jgi:Probable Zinc-ribbon domain
LSIKTVTIDNCFATTHPELASQLLDSNIGFKYPAGSHVKVWWKCHCGHEWVNSIFNRVRLLKYDCPRCKSIEVAYPELYDQLVNKDNGKFSKGNNTKISWFCEKGHVYDCTISNRLLGKGCPFCKNKRVCDDNCLVATNPEYVNELVDKNDAYKYTARSGVKLLWKCDDDHRWLATPNKRIGAGRNCPSCSVSGFKPELHSYLYVLRAPTHIVYGISNVDSKPNRVSMYPSDRKLLYKFEGNGFLVRDTETAIGRRFVRYEYSTVLGERKESLVLGQENNVYNFLIESGLVEA